MSAVFQAGRSNSRMSVASKQGGGSRASDEDGKPTVSVKVGRFIWKLSVAGTIVGNEI